MFAKLSWLCYFVGVSLLVYGGLLMVLSGGSRQNEISLTVEVPEQDLGEQTIGIHTFELRIRKASAQPRRILGATGH